MVQPRPQGACTTGGVVIFSNAFPVIYFCNFRTSPKAPGQSMVMRAARAHAVDRASHYSDRLKDGGTGFHCATAPIYFEPVFSTENSLSVRSTQLQTPYPLPRHNLWVLSHISLKRRNQLLLNIPENTKPDRDRADRSWLSPLMEMDPQDRTTFMDGPDFLFADTWRVLVYCDLFPVSPTSCFEMKSKRF